MQWFEDESFWEDFYPALFPETRFAAAATEVEQLLALAGVTGGSALDLCCGPGRHSKVLAARGFNVTAVDLSPFLLAKAREHTAGFPIEFIQADMRAFVRPFAFDLVVSLFTSFGYFSSPDQDLLTLRCIRSSLKPGGVLMLDMASKETFAQEHRDTQWHDLPGGQVFVLNTHVLPNWSRVHNDALLVRPDGTAARATFELNLYSGIELVALLANAGFTDVELFGDFAGAPYDARARRLVARVRA